MGKTASVSQAAGQKEHSLYICWRGKGQIGQYEVQGPPPRL